MSNPSVHLPLDRIHTSQRRSPRTEFDQEHGRGSAVPNSDAFDDEVGTTLECVLLDQPKHSSGGVKRCVISASATPIRGIADGKGEGLDTYLASYQ